MYLNIQQSYFLINLLPGDSNTFDIIVPTTNHGTKLLCSIVDNVEALIDEWFPGLRDLDIINGDSLVKPMSICPLCTGRYVIEPKKMTHLGANINFELHTSPDKDFPKLQNKLKTTFR